MSNETSLDALADEETQRKARPCWVCSLPEREWVDKAIKEGRSMTVIAAVLVRQGHAEATEHRIKTHKYKHDR